MNRFFWSRYNIRSLAINTTRSGQREPVNRSLTIRNDVSIKRWYHKACCNLGRTRVVLGARALELVRGARRARAALAAPRVVRARRAPALRRAQSAQRAPHLRLLLQPHLPPRTRGLSTGTLSVTPLCEWTDLPYFYYHLYYNLQIQNLSNAPLTFRYRIRSFGVRRPFRRVRAGRP